MSESAERLIVLREECKISGPKTNCPSGSPREFLKTQNPGPHPKTTNLNTGGMRPRCVICLTSSLDDSAEGTSSMLVHRRYPRASVGTECSCLGCVQVRISGMQGQYQLRASTHKHTTTQCCPRTSSWRELGPFHKSHILLSAAHLQGDAGLSTGF